MANVKISELSPLITVQDADVLPIVDNAVTKKVTAAILRSYTEGNSVLLTGAQTVAGIKTFTSQLASSVATGTAPFSVASTTKVTNLNADLLDGLSSADFQATLSGTGIVKSTAGTISYLTDNSTNWDSAYNDSITSAAVTGTTTKLLTLNQQDGGTITASWTDDNTDAVTSVFGRTGAVVATEGDYSLTQLSDVTLTSPANGQVLKYNGTAWVNGTDLNSGTVTSVGMTVPTGLSVSGSPITTSGTLAVSMASGYSLPTDASQATWNTAYNDSIVSAGVTGTSTKTLTLNQQDGGTVTASWSDADTGLTSVGLSMPSAFSVANSPLTANGTLAVTGAGTTSEYVRGDGSLATFPSLTGYVPYTGATTNVNLGTHSLTASDLVINHASGSGVAASITKGGSGEALTVVKSSGSGNAASITGGTTLISELHLTTDLADAYIASAATWNAKQDAITLTTTGTSGAATLVGSTLNIPNYADTDTGITSLNGLTALTQTFAVGTSGTDFGISSATSTHTFNLPTASATNRGALSSADWTTFNNKQNALTNPITGTGTTNYLPKFTGASALGNSQLFDNGNVGIGNAAPFYSLDLTGQTIRTARIYSASTDTRIYLQNTTSGAPTTDAGLMTGLIVNDAYFFNYQAGNTIFGTSGSERMRITSAGNVGIGTTTPAYKFEVSDGTRTAVINPNASLDGIFLGVKEAKPLVFGTSDNERMRIAANGNVLIGTTTDAGYKLDVNGTARLSSELLISTPDDSGMRIKAGATRLSYIDFADANTGTPSGSISYNHTSDYFVISVGGSNAEKMRVKSNTINISNIPTSAAGLSAGDIYSNLGVLTIV
jgi:hypothetical protein